ncbi:MAG: Cna B-type domain-containing protein [Fibrobacteria bacterium]|nr:Cna B-type domain-containing protein [Fibrobacteria bacterium]
MISKLFLGAGRINGLFAVALLLVLQQCVLFSEEDKQESTDDVQTENGSFEIQSPVKDQAIELNGALNISWKDGDSLSEEVENVIIELYRDGKQVLTIAGRATNTNSYDWRVLPSVGSGSNYQIKISNYDNPDEFDMSNYFRIYSAYYGAIQVTTPGTGASVKIGSSAPIAWTVSGVIGDMVGIALYKDSTKISTISTGTNNDSSYTWSPSSSLSSGDDYRIAVYSYSDGGIIGYSSYFSITSQYEGTYTFSSPVDSTVWDITNNSFPIQWSYTGNPGGSVSLELYRDSAKQITIVNTTTNDGNYTWSSSIMYEAGNRYRLKIISRSDAGVYNWSDYFTIKGVTPDSYERDNVRDSAVAIKMDSVQERTIYYGDQDWMRFTADSAQPYFVKLSCEFISGFNVYIYSGEKTNALKTFNSSPGGVFIPIEAGTHYIRVTNSSNTYREYTFLLSALSPGELVSFSSPKQGTVWSAGSSYEIAWETDSSFFNSSIRIYLFKDSRQYMSIDASETDDGSYNWNIPGYLETDSSYQIQISDYSRSEIYGLSPFFSIAGIASDQFEPDNQKKLAITFEVNAEKQNRTINRNDSDWVSFSADSGKSYLISIQDLNLSVLIADTASSILSYTSSPTSPRMFEAPQSGTFYLLIRSTSASVFGDYNLKISGFDPGALVGFSNPQKGTVWSAGSRYDIQWQADSSLFGTNVRIYLYKNSQQDLTIDNSELNDGLYSWTIPNYLETDSSYQIQVRDFSQSQIYGMSPFFSIAGLTRDSYENDNQKDSAKALDMGDKAQVHSLTRNDSDWVVFSGEAGTSYLITIEGLNSMTVLLEGSDGSVLSYTSSLTAPRLWECEFSGPYHLLIRSTSTSVVGDYTLAVSVFNPEDVAVFTQPVSSDVLVSGASITVAWEVTESFASSYQLLLCREGYCFHTLDGTVNASGTQSVSLPQGLASASDYRIRIAARGTSTNSIYGHSEVFSISGIIGDSHEFNDSLQAAKKIEINAEPLQLSLSYADEDWFYFECQEKMLYTLSTSGSVAARPQLFDSNETSITAVTVQDDSTVAWFGDRDGSCYFRVSKSSGYGDYSLQVKGFDSTSYAYTFISPEAASYQRDSSMEVSWTNAMELKSKVDLFLFNSQGVVTTIRAGYTSSNTYNWTIPSTLVPGEDYYIKVLSTINSSIQGQSVVFSIQ